MTTVTGWMPASCFETSPAGTSGVDSVEEERHSRATRIGDRQTTEAELPKSRHDLERELPRCQCRCTSARPVEVGAVGIRKVLRGSLLFVTSEHLDHRREFGCVGDQVDMAA